MKKIKQYIVESVQDGYVIESLLRNISLAVASGAIACGIVILLFGWQK